MADVGERNRVPTLIGDDRETIATRLAESMRSPGRVMPGLDGYLRAAERDAAGMYTRTTLKPLGELRDWFAGTDRGVIAHKGGHFFTVEGLRTRHADPSGVLVWEQPIIVQTEVGILGIIAREIDGVLHFLIQNKAEPGNRNGIQISPTVQATRSNFTRAHGGSPIPYLAYFLDGGDARHRTLVDVRQSEHGSRFYRKRNRNVVIEVDEDIDTREGFYWLTLGQLSMLMALDDLVNLDTRSVISCLPYFTETADVYDEPGDFTASLHRSGQSGRGGVHSRGEIASWITRTRSETRLGAEPRSLGSLDDWQFGYERIARRDGRFFDVVGVEVEADGREVGHWDQPMISGGTSGVVALVVRRFDGVLHALLQLRAEAGSFDGPELCPTVQCDPRNYSGTDGLAEPRLLDRILTAPADRIRFDTMLSAEGGRFYHTSHRHLIVELDDVAEPPGFRWLTLWQIGELLQHSNYLNEQARSLVACLRALLAEGDR